MVAVHLSTGVAVMHVDDSDYVLATLVDTVMDYHHHMNSLVAVSKDFRVK